MLSLTNGNIGVTDNNHNNTNNSSSNNDKDSNLNNTFKNGNFTQRFERRKRKINEVNDSHGENDDEVNLRKKKRNPHYIYVDNIVMGHSTTKMSQEGDYWDYRDLGNDEFDYTSNSSLVDNRKTSDKHDGDKACNMQCDEQCDEDDGDDDDDDDVNFNQGDTNGNGDGTEASNADGEATEVPKPVEDPDKPSDGKIVTEMSWMPHMDGGADKLKALSEYEIIEQKMNRRLQRREKSRTGENSSGDDDGECDTDGEDETDELVGNYGTQLPDDIEAREMDIENFGNLGQFKLLDGQTIFDDIKRALINCNHGIDEYKYCKMVADKFNDAIARPYNERRELKLKMLNVRNPPSTVESGRQSGQQRIDSYFIKGPVAYWTTEKVHTYRQKNVCPISSYLDMANGFRDIHVALRGSVVYEHRNEVYPNGKPVIKAEDKIWKVVKEAADMYFKFMNAKPQDSIYANSTRKVLTGINDLFDTDDVQNRSGRPPSTAGGGGRGNRKGGNSNGGRKGGSGNGDKPLVYNHPSLERTKNRKSVGAIPKVGGYNVNSQVNQYKF